MLGQFLINGIITGLLYSLLAIGFALVYNTTKLFHITAAAIYIFAAYMFYLFAVTFGLPVFVAAIISLILTMLLSLLTDISVYRPLKKRKASNNVAMIASIGMMTVIVNFIAMFFGNETKVIDNTIHRTYSLGDVTMYFANTVSRYFGNGINTDIRRVLPFGNIIITTPQMYQMVIGSIVIVAFLLFISKSQWGIRFRALSANSVLYETLGYNTAHARTFVFLLSGFFIATASCLTVYDIGLDPHMGMNVLINALVAMIIGGVGRFGTCVIGGLSLGILQALTVWQFSSNWQNAVTFVLLLILLFLRPQGIAGVKQRTV